MKKILSILLISVLTFTLSACSNEMSGKYTLSSIEINNSVYVEGDEGWEDILGMNIAGENIYIELKNNGNLTYAVTSLNVREGTWSEDNSVITMVIDGYEEKAVYQDQSLVLETDNAKLIFEK